MKIYDIRLSTTYMRIIAVFFVFVTLLAFQGCSFPATGDEKSNSREAGLEETIVHLEYQATIQALQATVDAKPNEAVEVETSEPVPTATAEPLATAVQPPELPTPETSDLWERMKEANILLFEDMIGMPKVRRYAKETLDQMGLKYEDVGSEKGTLKERLVFRGAGGQPYDLIILAIENRQAGKVSGEFFDYLRSNLDHGTSVIIEAWHLDQVAEGTAKPILDECGIKVDNYTGAQFSEMDLVLWPISIHPILTEPNNYPKLTRPIFFWRPDDYGDLMELTGKGDAQLLIGRNSNRPDKYGVVAVCMDGQLILQTFSSHSYYLEPMVTVWENYIYNALKARFQGSQEQD